MNTIAKTKELQKKRRELLEIMKTKIKINMKNKEHKEKQQKINKEKQHYHSLNTPFVLKSHYNSIIPLHTYTCWHTKDLPPIMRENYNNLINQNPEFQHHLSDENDCLNFIQNNFEQDVVDAYNKLIPNSYKSDLWRFCVMYINGGIYFDIKYNCANGFKMIDLTESEHYVRDRPERCIYTALIVCLPKNEIMLKCIRQIVKNVKNKYYGGDALSPTGPALLGAFYTNSERSSTPLYFEATNSNIGIDVGYIAYNKIIILNYDNTTYRKEQNNNKLLAHYSELWENKNIYHK
jgi:mannosyltransferase OCH1-like enzyme